MYKKLWIKIRELCIRIGNDSLDLMETILDLVILFYGITTIFRALGRIVKGCWDQIQKDYFHVLWFLVVVTFGLLSTWLDFLRLPFDCAWEKFVKSNDVYIATLGMLAPGVFSLLYQIYDKHNKNENLHFMRLHFAFVIFGFIICSIVPIFAAVQSVRSYWLTKVVIATGIILYTFVCYLIQFFDQDKYSDFDDPVFIDYCNAVNDLKEESRNTSKASLEDDEVEL